MKRRGTDQHLVRQAAESVDVGPIVDRRLASRLFRAHVLRGPHGDAGPGQGISGKGQSLGDPEVRDYCTAVIQQDVVRLDIAVNDAFGVRVAEGGGHLADDADGFVDR